MAEHLLQRAHIHTVLQHEGRRRMPQFMCGILAGIQPRTSQFFLTMTCTESQLMRVRRLERNMAVVRGGAISLRTAR